MRLSLSPMPFPFLRDDNDTYTTIPAESCLWPGPGKWRIGSNDLSVRKTSDAPPRDRFATVYGVGGLAHARHPPFSIQRIRPSDGSFFTVLQKSPDRAT